MKLSAVRRTQPFTIGQNFFYNSYLIATMATWQTTTRYEDEECQNEKKKSEREILPQIVLFEVERLSQVLILKILEHLDTHSVIEIA